MSRMLGLKRKNMSTERSDKIHDYWRQSSEKFDYFVTGMTGALCAYILQTFKPEQISITPNTLELISLLVLIISVYAGFKRIESTVETFKRNHQSLYLSEQVGQLITNYKGSHLINKATGEIMPPEIVELKIQTLKEIQPKVKGNTDKAATASGNWYKLRNLLLSLGFLILVASKIWSAYT